MFQLISDKVKINEGSYVETINTKYFVVCHERPQSEGQYSIPGGGGGGEEEEERGGEGRRVVGRVLLHSPHSFKLKESGHLPLSLTG